MHALNRKLHRQDFLSHLEFASQKRMGACTQTFAVTRVSSVTVLSTFLMECNAPLLRYIRVLHGYQK